MGNESNHTVDGLTVIGTLTVETAGGGDRLVIGARDSVVDAADFGVVGDGSASSASQNTAGINAAIGAAKAAGGGRVELPYGYIITNGTITNLQYVYVTGQGPFGTVVQLATNANCDMYTAHVSTGVGDANASWTGLSNLTLDGRKDNQSGSGPYCAIRMNTNPSASAQTGTSGAFPEWFDMHHRIDNVRVYGAKGSGIKLSGRSAIQISRVLVEGVRDYGIESTFDLNMHMVEVSSCGLSGFYLNNGSIRATTCKAYLNGQTHTADGDGFRLGPNANGVALSACEAQNNWVRGFYLTSANRCNIHGIADSNNMAAGSYSGVELDASSYNIIDVVCWQGMQGGSPVGNQDTGLKIAGGSNYNRVTVSHSGGLGDSVTGPAVSADSVMLQNWIVANGLQVAG